MSSFPPRPDPSLSHDPLSAPIGAPAPGPPPQHWSVPPTRGGPMLKPHRAGTVLTLGIVGLVLNFGCGLGWILGIIAWVMGNADLREMDAGIMDPAGRSNTQAGRICGIISVVLTIIGVLAFLAYIIFVVVVFGAVAAGAAGAGAPR